MIKIEMTRTANEKNITYAGIMNRIKKFAPMAPYTLEMVDMEITDDKVAVQFLEKDEIVAPSQPTRGKRAVTTLVDEPNSQEPPQWHQLTIDELPKLDGTYYPNESPAWPPALQPRNCLLTWAKQSPTCINDPSSSTEDKVVEEDDYEWDDYDSDSWDEDDWLDDDDYDMYDDGDAEGTVFGSPLTLL